MCILINWKEHSIYTCSNKRISENSTRLQPIPNFPNTSNNVCKFILVLALNITAVDASPGILNDQSKTWPRPSHAAALLYVF